jgi:hypothetical protein
VTLLAIALLQGQRVPDWLAASHLSFNLFDLFVTVAAASVLFGTVCMTSVLATPWGTAPSKRPARRGKPR